ncbi:hypothetical protein P692DRAFT_201810794 [Suillus brevipes Sb2]|nr:hypothetical protein P692DRAFT_201810794 [Suillus brevipes Sb2]
MCPQVNKLITDGKLQHNGHQVTRSDGQTIRCLPEESILEALNCEGKVPITHFIKYELSEDEKTETEDEAYAFPVERVTRNSTQGRQERFKEVFPPGQSKNIRKTNDKDKGKDKVPNVPAKKAKTQAKPKSTQPTLVAGTKPIGK